MAAVLQLLGLAGVEPVAMAACIALARKNGLGPLEASCMTQASTTLASPAQRQP